MAIWHIVAGFPLEYGENLPVISSFLRWLLNSPYSNINVLSDAGESPFCVALKSSNFKMADYLLSFGADPTLHGDHENDPFNIIDELLKSTSHQLSFKQTMQDAFGWHKSENSERREIERDEEIKALENQVQEITRYKKRMIIIKNYEVKKNATLLAQAKRTDSLPLASLPEELLSEIGVRSKWFSQTAEEAKKSFVTAFFRPKQVVVKEYVTPELQEEKGCVIS